MFTNNKIWDGLKNFISVFDATDITLIVICLIFGAIAVLISLLRRKKDISNITVSSILSIMIGFITTILLWEFLNTKKELFTSLTGMISLVVTIMCGYFQYQRTLIDKLNTAKKNARPEIEFQEILPKDDELLLKFTLRSNTLQTLININGEVFTSFDKNAESYEHIGHFDNIGSALSSEKHIAKIKLDESNKRYNDILSKKFTGFEYLIFSEQWN